MRRATLIAVWLTTLARDARLICSAARGRFAVVAPLYFRLISGIREGASMRQLLAIAVSSAWLILVSTSPSFADAFCEGFERGYIAGYKRASGSGFDPFTPFCPYQPFKKFSDPESDSERGYLIGLERGTAEGRERR
jgi:hypothetical protein